MTAGSRREGPGRLPGKRWRWTLTGGYAALLVVLAVVPSPAPYVAPGVSDSVLHAAGYGVLALLVAWSAQPSLSDLFRTAIAGAAGAVLLGVATELLQGLVPWRSAELRDVRSDLIGAVLGVFVWLVASRALARLPWGER